jgi:hypothetical protein
VSKRQVRALVLAALSAMLGLALFAPASSLALPEGRVYEMVSPVFKGGYGANTIVAGAPDGESVAFGSAGSFAGAPSNHPESGNPYIARRGPSGWSTASLSPPASLSPEGSVEDYSATLGEALSVNDLGPNSQVGHAGTQGVVLLHSTGVPDTEAGWSVAGPVLETLEKTRFKPSTAGASPDFSHIVLGALPGEEEREAPLLPEAKGETSGGQLYDLVASGPGAPSLRLLGVTNGLGPNGEPEPIDLDCPVVLGPNALAADGRVIFFLTNVNRSEKTHCSSPLEPVPANPAQLFVRLDGSKTLEVSRPLSPACVEVPCAGAAARAEPEISGVSEDGSRVFFTAPLATGQPPLVPGDTDSSNNLYMATIGCPGGEGACELAQREVTSLTQVSHDPKPGEATEVQNVVSVAPDGSRVYFIAHGVLGEGSTNAQSQAPVRGADNLYVYEPDPEHEGQYRTVFVADLCSGPARSGEAENLHCPPTEARDLAPHLSLTAQTAAQDGRFLLFSSVGRLVAGDTDNARDVYRYDAVTGALDRVSIGEEGFDANGNNDAFGASIRVQASSLGRHEEAITEDGSRVVFATAEPLSPHATNHLANVYEWHRAPGETGEGHVSLISTGTSIEPTEDVVISPSGRDVFFTTAQGLVPQDTDGQLDLYDARIGGGFPALPAPARECSGDACQGPLTNPAPLLVPGSVAQAPGDDFAAPISTTTVKPEPKSRPAKCKKRHAKKQSTCGKPSRKRARGKR